MAVRRSSSIDCALFVVVIPSAGGFVILVDTPYSVGGGHPDRVEIGGGKVKFFDEAEDVGFEILGKVSVGSEVS
jgi:hypothetical protein